jgi:transketolase
VRREFVRTLCALARRDERIVLLTADLGYMALEPFRDEFPKRFFNAGVAEQNMIGVATGLAEAGLIPFAYSIAPFAAFRPFEFIRNGPVLHDLPVRIVGMGMGFEYGHAGPTHFAVEDVGVMRTLPRLAIVIPADARQTGPAVEATWNHAGPVYYSLGKDDQTVVEGLDGRFALGRLQIVREGRGVLLVTMGSIAAEVQRAAAELAKAGSDPCVAIVSSFNPAPVEDLAQLLSRFHAVVTVEAHVLSGGVGSLVCETVAERGLKCRVKRLAVAASPDGTSGSQSAMWRKHGLDRDAIAAAAMASRESAIQ